MFCGILILNGTMANKLGIKERANQALLCLFCSIAIFTPFYGQSMVVILGVAVIWFLSTLFVDWKWIKGLATPVLLLLIFILLDYINGLMRGSTSAMLLGVNKMPVFVWYLVFLFYRRNIELFNLPMNVVLLMLFIGMLYTINGNVEYPGASRLLAGVDEIYAENRALFRSMNIGGYDFIYSIAFTTLPLCCLIKVKQNISRAFLLSWLIISFVTIVMGAYMIAILLSVLLTIAALINTKKFNLIQIVVFVLIGYLFYNTALEFLISVGDEYGLTSLSKHAEELMKGNYSSGDKDNNRFYIYLNSIKNWLDSPILGTMNGTIHYRRSGHSQFLGFLETYGFFVIFYVCFFVSMYRRMYESFKTKEYRSKFKVYYMIMLLFGFINRFDTFMGLGFTMFFFVPMMLLNVEKRNSVFCKKSYCK